MSQVNYKFQSLYREGELSSNELRFASIKDCGDTARRENKDLIDALEEHFSEWG